MDITSRTARQVTHGADVDSRPAWHPDGVRLTLVRDNGRDTRIVIVDVESGELLHTINTPAIDLDPTFTPDGRILYYTSGVAGTLDVWALDLHADSAYALTGDPGIEMKPQPRSDGAFITLAKWGSDLIELRRGADSRQPILSGNIASMARPALSPDEQTLAVNWPTQNGWDLRLYNLQAPQAPIVLLSGRLPLTPAWGDDGQWIYFSEADDNETMHLHRAAASGGEWEKVTVNEWSWQAETARIRITTSGPEGEQPSHPLPARLSVVDASGHPAVPDSGWVYFDGTNGRYFFYSPDTVEITVLAGAVTVSATRGLATPEVTATINAAPGTTADVRLLLEPLWDARAMGWASGDHHFHLNYGGHTHPDPSDLVPMMRGEALDMATPLLANLHNRIEDQHYWGWPESQEAPFIRVGQEVRSHFLGHVGLIGTPRPYWPWMWGPGYEIYGTDDRPNADVLEWAHALGGIGFYVHPVSSADPFAEGGGVTVPIELIADAVLGVVDALEIICLWSNSYGITALWHQLLNLGLPIAPTAGTDVMLNLHRTMALGTTRVYVRTGDHLDWPSYISGLREGRSMVTNGPFLEFAVAGMRPGDVVAPGRSEWMLDLYTASEVDTVEIFVNGQVVATHAGLRSPGWRSYSGTIDLPDGGWIAARARGGATRWPSMDAAPYAQTAPVWIAEKGSTHPAAQRSSALLLQDLLTDSYTLLRFGYGDASIPRLEARFRTAMERLEQLAAEDG